jgi:4-methyl-5(b-hydroxyethyl)-thiazole monophosphate biosynthesis
MGSGERILVPLAEGFEEIEAVTIVDVLRRAGLDVTLASLAPGPVRGGHGIPIVPDATLDELDLSAFGVLVCPGGQPGARNLMADERVLALARDLHARGRTTAAICAAPLVLHKAGILRGLDVTAHPSVQGELAGARLQTEPRVLRSGSVLTSQGAGTALEFALELVEELVGPAKAEELARAMIVRR